MSISKHPLYNTWSMMNQRCFNGEAPNYEFYGAIGISVCDRWSIYSFNGFKNFLKDMGDRPEAYTLDRIDPKGDYEPDNCRWASQRQQNDNRKNTLHVLINGEAYSFSSACRFLNASYSKLKNLIYRKGLTPQEVIDLHIERTS